jgi:hypothetical protein
MDLHSMTVAQLKAFGADYGLTFKSKARKADIIAEIERDAFGPDNAPAVEVTDETHLFPADDFLKMSAEANRAGRERLTAHFRVLTARAGVRSAKTIPGGKRRHGITKWQRDQLKAAQRAELALLR